MRHKARSSPFKDEMKRFLRYVPYDRYFYSLRMVICERYRDI